MASRPAVPVPQSDQNSAAALALADEIRTTVAALNRRFREQAGADDLTTAQKSVLLRLERDGPATTSALARAEAMRPQSMGAIVAALEAAGHVTGSPDPSDGRQTMIAVTDSFRAWLGAARLARRDWLFRTVQARLSPDEQARVSDAVALLRRLLDP